MLVAVLVAAGFVVAFAIAFALRTSRRLAALACIGVLGWLALFIWLHDFVDCSRVRGECNPDLGWFLALFVLAGWLLGVVCGGAARSRLRGRRTRRG